jgi:hypothetical protein
VSGKPRGQVYVSAETSEFGHVRPNAPGRTPGRDLTQCRVTILKFRLPEAPHDFETLPGLLPVSQTPGLGLMMKPEVANEQTTIQPRVQA